MEGIATQQAQFVKKGTKWASQIRIIAKPLLGITPKYARWLFISVTLPRILYTADVWCVDSQGVRGRVSKLGLAKALDQMATIQRAGALAIIGGLRTSATDSPNTYLHLLPSALMVRKWCHQVLIRLAALPKEHLLHRHMRHQNTGKIKKHRGVEIRARTVHVCMECEILIEIFPYLSLDLLIRFCSKSMNILCI